MNQESKQKERKKPHHWIEEAFESILFSCRFLALFAVIGSMVAALILYLKGTVEIAQGVKAFMAVIGHFTPTAADDKAVILAFIPAIDNYLFATVLMIFSMGIYELFISKIDPSLRKSGMLPKNCSMCYESPGA